METQTWRQLLDLLNSMDAEALDQTRTIEIDGEIFESNAIAEPGPSGANQVKDRGHRPAQLG